MKHVSAFLSILFFAFACTPDLEPEVIPDSEDEPQTEEPTVVPETEEPTVIPVQSIELSEVSLSLEPGDKATLTATVTPDDATNKTIVWASSNETVATVSQDGAVAALTEGECTVTASCDGKEAECTVTVALQVISVSSVSLSSSSESLFVGETVQLTAAVLPENATDRTVVWTTSDEGVATVDDGLISAVSAGEATITATAGECSATCIVTVSVPFSYDGMCLESVSEGCIVISNPNQLTIEYKVENADWQSSSSAEISIKTKATEKVWFRGVNDSYTLGDPYSELYVTTFRCYYSEYYLYGNLMSLLYGDDFESKKEINGEHAFCKMFYRNDNIINHPEKDIVLPATTLSAFCYRNMFSYCSKLTRAPKLPAKVLTEACYASMFLYCSALKDFPEMDATDMAEMSCTWMMMGTGLETAPELPAMNLARSCYEFMFSECPDLKKGPSILPATELAASCYKGMFQRCNKLEETPELPATDLVFDCYNHMYNGCKSLKKAPKLPATKLASTCYQRMFGNSGLVEAPELPAMEMEYMCYAYMFEGCTSLEKAPVLPATALDFWCYKKMFSGCSSLNYIKMMGKQIKEDTWMGYKLVDLTNDNIDEYCTEWVEGVDSEGVFVKNQEAVWDVQSENGVPEGWEIQYE